MRSGEYGGSWMRSQNQAFPSVDFVPLLVRKDPELFWPLKVGAFEMSIQASAWHNCDPKEGGLPASDYVAFEVTISGPEGSTLGHARMKLMGIPHADDFLFDSVSYLTKIKVQAIFDFLRNFQGE